MAAAALGSPARTCCWCRIMPLLGNTKAIIPFSFTPQNLVPYLPLAPFSPPPPKFTHSYLLSTLYSPHIFSKQSLPFPLIHHSHHHLLNLLVSSTKHSKLTIFSFTKLITGGTYLVFYLFFFFILIHMCIMFIFSQSQVKATFPFVSCNDNNSRNKHYHHYSLPDYV